MITPEVAAKTVARLYRELNGRRNDVGRYEAYYRGEQPLAYASAEWRNFHAERFRNFSDNWCGVVANAPAERTRLNGLRLGDKADNFSDAEKLLMRDWHINDMDLQSSQGFLHSITTGRSFVMGWYSGDELDPVEYTWERSDQVIVAYEPGNRRRRVAALKAWTDDDGDDGLEFATLYLPDAIWKFQRPSGLIRSFQGLSVWTPREVPGEPWPLSNPLGIVPVVEFPNRPLLGGEPMSDIAGTVAMQDAINLLWAYLFSAADFASMPARVVMGQEPPKIPVLDNNGNKIGEKPIDSDVLTRGRMLWLTGQDTKIGQWEAAKLDGFTDIINRCVRHVGAQTRTPIHYIVGEFSNINGEVLQALESPLCNKVEESQLFLGPAGRDLFSMGALIRGDKELARMCRLATILWADAETRTTAQTADAAIKDKAVGFPLAAILERRYGLTQPEIDRVIAMRESENAGLLGGDLAAAFGPKQPAPVPAPV